MFKNNFNDSSIDVFISHEHNMEPVVSQICMTLESSGIRCWYAPRDVIGDYATSIVNAIEKTKIFVILLNNAASKSVHVLNEVEIAYKRIVEKDANITILPFKLDSENLSKAMEYYIKRLHWIDASSQGIEKAIQELHTKIVTILYPSVIRYSKQERQSNAYYDENDDKERKRLVLQEKILAGFDSKLYEKVSNECERMRVLDLGSANGHLVMDRIGKRNNLEYLLGLEYNEVAVQSAQKTYGNDKIHFEQCDLEKFDIEFKLRQICDKYEISGFNVIHISMLFLHLKNPLRILKIIRKFAERNAILIIKDIDDGFNVAFPDSSGIFGKIIHMCRENHHCGYRLSGREIPFLLKKSGYSNVKLENLGINTLGMNYDEREALFHVYFSFIKDDYKILADENPENTAIQNTYNWIKENYEKLEDEFINENFFFNLGFMLFSAKK